MTPLLFREVMRDDDSFVEHLDRCARLFPAHAAEYLVRRYTSLRTLESICFSSSSVLYTIMEPQYNKELRSDESADAEESLAASMLRQARADRFYRTACVVYSLGYFKYESVRRAALARHAQCGLPACILEEIDAESPGLSHCAHAL